MPTEGLGEGTREHAGSPSLDPTPPRAPTRLPRAHAGSPSLDPTPPRAPTRLPRARGFEVIASVRGGVIARGGDHVVVEVRGVGYKVFVPRDPASDEVLLHTHQVVREDGQWLYGFETRDELALFELLIGVSGVGPKAALAILSVARPSEVAAAIASGDAAALARAPGVGKKTAERLIVDLRSKVGKVGANGGGPSFVSDDDAHAALVALGYTAAEASAALRGVPAKGRASTEERLSAALRASGRTLVAEG